MALTVRCPHCSGEIKGRDADAGKTLNCPTCGGAFQFPAAAAPAAPRAARPVQATPARRPDDEADRPVRRAAKHDEDEKNDRPQQTPPKKKSKLGLILVLVGGVLLLGCGACGGLGYWIVSKGRELANVNVTSENAEKLREGMTQKEVEAILGAGKPASRADVVLLESDTTLTMRRIAEDHEKYWHPWADKGLVHVWRNGAYYVLVAYNDPPESGGKLKGLDYFTLKDGANVHYERIPLPRMLAADNDAVRHGLATKTGGATSQPPKTNQPPDDTQSAKITAEELLANPKQYVDKVVTVTGKIKDIDPTATGAYLRMESADAAKTIRCDLDPDTLRSALAGGHGGNIVIEGKVAGELGAFVDVVNCRVVRSTPSGSALLTVTFAREFQTSSSLAQAKYDGKKVRLTGAIVSFEKGVVPTVVLRGVEPLKGKAGAKPIRVVVAYSLQWKDEFAKKKVGDTITISGEYSSFLDGTITINNCWPMR